MLEFLRKHSQSFMMWLLVGAIGFIFVVQFGPQSRGCRQQQGGPAYVAKVHGTVISETAFRWAWIFSRASSIPRDQQKALRLKEAVLNGLIERELLAHAASKLGIVITEDDVDDTILGGTLYYNASVHSPVRMPSGPIPIDFTKEDGSFDYDTFKMMVNGQFQMTLNDFKVQQIKEILADKMRKIVENSVRLYPNEARDEYEKMANWVKVETATFDPFQYARTYKPTESEISSWADANSETVEKYYKDDEYKFKNVEKQVRIRNILVKVGPDADDEEKEEKLQLARDIVDKASGKADFAALAKKHSEDAKTRDAGGDTGFHARGYFEEKLEDVVFGMKPDEVKGPTETDEGYQVVECVGFREGSIPLEEVRMEIAEKLMTEERSKTESAADAGKLLDLLAGGAEFTEAVDSVKEMMGVQEEPEEEGADAGFKVDIPAVKTSGEIRQNDAHIAGVGTARDLVEEILAMDENAKYLTRVVDVNGKFHVITIKERHKADDAEFLEQTDSIRRKLLAEKKLALVEQWIDGERKKAEDKKAILIEQMYLKYPGDETETEETAD
ncbi:MAG: SurA N-terminal domain-containing protein [Pseudomonadota bacterium]